MPSTALSWVCDASFVVAQSGYLFSIGKNTRKCLKIVCEGTSNKKSWKSGIIPSSKRGEVWLHVPRIQVHRTFGHPIRKARVKQSYREAWWWGVGGLDTLNKIMLLFAIICNLYQLKKTDNLLIFIYGER